MSRHSKTPWHVQNSYGIANQEKYLAMLGSATTTDEETIANAAHIVKCVNLYDELVHTIEVLEQTVRNLGMGLTIGESKEIAMNASANAVAVLAKTKEMK